MKIVLVVILLLVVVVVLGVILFFIKILPAINKAIDMAEKHPPIESSRSVSETILGMEKYEYFCSDGGPFILMPSAIKHQWKGVGKLLNVLSPKTDYGRACQVVYSEGAYGMINAYSNQVFVVDSPMLATNKECDGKSVIIYALVSWQVDNLDALIDIACSTLQEEDFTSTEESIQCKDGFVFMYAGDIYDDCLYGVKNISAKAGIYNISKACWKEDGNEVRIFKFTLNQQD